MSSSGGDDSTGNRQGTGAASGLGDVSPAMAAQLSLTDMAMVGHAHGHSDSTLASRYLAARNAGLAFGSDRDYYEVLGYDRQPTAEEYYAKYLRNDIARRIVNAPPKASWSERPVISDDPDSGDDDDATTDFEQAIEYLFDEHRLLHYLKRADIVSGIGEYGLLFFGLAPGDDDMKLRDDARDGTFRSILDTRRQSGPDDLAYLSTFSQTRVVEMDTVDDPRNPRYGLPDVYNLEFTTDDTSRSELVHHSRVIHIAEELLENEVFGRPRLEAILNRLEDLEKVIGGSAEMYWRGADRKMQLNYTGDGTITDGDELADQAEDMIHGLRNVLRTSNVELNEIEGQSVDPSGIVEQLLKLIAGETGIPLRMLTGSERGELASTQDRATFYERIMERREQFCEPSILRPVIDRLVTLGILPEPEGGEYTVEWPQMFELNELETAELRRKNAESIKKAAPMGDPAQLATVPEIRENILNWDPERGTDTSMDAPAVPDLPEDQPPDGDAPGDTPRSDPADDDGEPGDDGANPGGQDAETVLEDIIEDLNFEEQRETLLTLKQRASVTFRGTKTGSLDESNIPNDDFAGHYLFSGRTKSESSYPVVDGDGYLRRANVDTAFKLGPRGNVTRKELWGKLRKLNQEFDNPPINQDRLESDDGADS